MKYNIFNEFEKIEFLSQIIFHGIERCEIQFLMIFYFESLVKK